MNMYIFRDVDQVSSRYHEDGSIAVVATDIEMVKKLVADDGYVVLTEEDISTVIVYPLKGKHEPKLFVFPNAGCC